MKRVSVIVVNWNGAHLLAECLSALRAQTYPDVEVIVVDNASTDDSVEYVQRQFPQVRLVVLAQNLGFAGGNVEGLKSACGDYIALLNNDAVAAPNWLGELVSAMEDDERIGSCASKLVVYDRSDRIDSAGDSCATSGHGCKRGNGELVATFSDREPVFGACAGAALYRRSMIDDIGFLDEDFFLQCEDTDLNFRAQLMGWRCVFVPTAVVMHKVSTTIARLNGLPVYYSSRNEEFVWIKNMPASLMLRYLHHKLLQEAGAVAYYCFKRGEWRPFLRGKLDALRQLPRYLRKRREIQRRRRVPPRELARTLTPLFDRQLVRDKLGKLFSPRRERIDGAEPIVHSDSARTPATRPPSGNETDVRRIIVNGIPLLGPRSGVGTYVFNTFRSLLQMDGPWDYCFFYGLRSSPQLWDRTPEIYASARRMVQNWGAFYALSRRLSEMAFRTGQLRQAFDLYHETNFIPMGFDGPCVVTIHDLSFILYPGTLPRERLRYIERYFHLRVASARRIITVSAATKREIVRLLGIAPERIAVTPLGVGPRFQPLASDIVRPMLAKRGLTAGQYILYVGTLEPRKNIIRLLEAYSAVPPNIRRGHPLVLVGGVGWRMERLDDEIRRLRLDGNVVKPGYVSDNDLVALYNGATVFVYPSLYEGFGLPPLEAMACGAPVIASNVSSIPEVVGDAAILVDPQDVDSLRTRLEELIANPELCAVYRDRGFEQARKFSWKRCAEQTLAVYEDAIANRTPPATVSTASTAGTR